MDMLEEYATTRVRVDGKQEDRRTGNLVCYLVEHAETRPVGADNMPDPDRHIHVVIANLTWDDVEQKWKAVKFRPIMDIRKYFDRCFDTILAGKLAELGYEVDTKWKADGRFHSWDIKGIPDSVIKKNSRRSGEIAEVEQTILGNMKQENGVAPEQLSAVARDKLGATSRRGETRRPDAGGMPGVLEGPPDKAGNERRRRGDPASPRAEEPTAAAGGGEGGRLRDAA